jgi:hypothetical protein
MPGRAATQECSPASLEDFRPKLLGDLIRVGAECDGGYVVNERSVLHSQYLMSFGINDDWSFELDFLKRKPDVKVFGFDYSVSKSVFRSRMLNALNEILSVKFALLICSFNWSGVRRKLSNLKRWTKTYSGFSQFVAKKNVRFYARGVSNQSTATFSTFAEAFQSISSHEVAENSVFVKLDIEQSEFRVLPDLLKLERYINGLAIEFHDLDILWTQFVELMEQLKQHFEITHIHGNNYGGLIPNSEIPRVLEITFAKKDLISEEHSSCEGVAYPILGLDCPNNRLEKDYPLVF